MSVRGSLLRVVALLFALGCGFTEIRADVRVGTYSGNGTSLSVGGMPWSPDAVIIKGETNEVAVMRSASMTGDQTKPLVGSTGLTADWITSLDAFGFSVGSDDHVNKAGTTYHWAAFEIEPSMMYTGSYPGNGSSNRVIGDSGFPCHHTIVMSAGSHKAVHSTTTSNRSYDFEKNEYFDAIITPLPASGFRVGDNDSVNKSGVDYHYVCWQRVFGRQAFASWWGDGDDDQERVIGFRPEYVFVNSITASEDPTQRFRTIPDTTDQSLYFKAAGTINNHIQEILSNGIEVGDDDEVNKSGEGYAYFAWGPPGIGGVVFEDANFAGQAFDWDTGTADRALPNVDVELYNAADTLLMSVTTDSLGRYFFGGMAAGTYKIRVRSATIGDLDTPPKGGFNACVPTTCPYPLPEMNWGAGAPLYGGQNPAVDDTTAGTGDTWASVAFSGSDITNVHFGFAYNLIVNTTDDTTADNARSTQGSLRQFIKNANAIGTAGSTTASSSQFRIPTSDANYDIGSGVFRITALAGMPAVTDAATTLDAATQTTNIGNTNLAVLGAGGSVGVEAVALAQVAGPEIEIVAGAVLPVGIDVQANDFTLRAIAIYGFGSANNNGSVRIGLDETTNFTGTLIEQNVFGSSAASFTDPDLAVPGSGTMGCNLIVLGADGGTLQNNLIGYARRLGATINNSADDWTVTGNEFRRNGLIAARLDGLGFSNSTTRGVVTGNLFVDNQGAGVDFFVSLGSHTVRNNTIEQNGWGGEEPVGIRMFSSGSTIDRNVIRDNDGAGVLAVVEDAGFAQTPAIHNRITRNHFSGNGSNAIDLQTTLDVVAPGDGITLNDGTLLGDSSVPNACGIVAGHGNEGLDTPIIDVASISGGTTTVQGRACPGSEVEVYKAVADADASDTLSGTDYGEGLEYLDSTTADGVTGDFTVGGIADLSAGDAVSAIAIDGSSNTSEFAANVTIGTEIAGRVFEDVNYGGGDGRDYATSSGVGRQSARVELYDATDTFLDSTTTDGDGLYAFQGVPPDDYTVRVVNSTVTSSRTGYLATMFPVQNYRTDAAGGTAVAVTDHVGGEDPGKVDAGNGGPGTTLASLATATTTAQSITAVTVSSSAVPGIDFGFNFDTIVNINATDQGSLAQFLDNANGLANAGLAQVGRPAAIESAIFMLSDGTARPGMHAGYPTQFSSGVATIAPDSALPFIQDPAILDATLQPGYVDRPIIELDGTDAGNGVSGIHVSAGASTIRGFVINDFNWSGIRLDTVGGNTVTANWLGTDATGTAAAPNNQEGLYIDNVPGNVVGGTDSADRNVVSGNRLRGMLIEGLSATGNRIEGNYVGTDRTGTIVVPNDIGIYLSDAPGNVIGGTALDAGNLVSGNDLYGIYLVNAASSGNSVQGNTVGLRADGSGPLANVEAGIAIFQAVDSTIGGADPNAPNTITGSAIGIRLNGGSGIAIRRNTIYANDGLSIDHDVDDVTPNDGATGAGANNGLDYPIFTSARLSGAALSVKGYVGTPALKIPGPHTIEVFKADDDGNNDGEIVAGDGQSVPHGEGRWFVDSCSSAADGSFDCTLTVPGGVTLSVGDPITATATDGSGNTSEMAANAQVYSTLAIVKRAFQSDGTPIVSGSTLPRGMPVKFMLYIDNPSGAVADATLEDLLDPIFAYRAESMKVDNTLLSSAVCPGGVCDEAAIFSQVDGSGTALGDGDAVNPPTDLDVGSYIPAPPTIDLGDGNNTDNDQLDLAAGRVWAVVFTVVMQ